MFKSGQEVVILRGINTGKKARVAYSYNCNWILVTMKNNVSLVYDIKDVALISTNNTSLVEKINMMHNRQNYVKNHLRY